MSVHLHWSERGAHQTAKWKASEREVSVPFPLQRRVLDVANTMRTHLSTMSVRCGKTVSGTDAHRPVSRRHELMADAKVTRSENDERLLSESSDFRWPFPSRRSTITGLVAGCTMALSLPERPAWAVWEGAPEAPQVRSPSALPES